MNTENEKKGYDSRTDTMLHIKRVAQLLAQAAITLLGRANKHDQSKLESPEKEVFDEFTPKLAGSTYGSDEYKTFLKDMQVGLKHHYLNNAHHPEHYPNGINGFDLFDLIELFFDWKAATERHNDGNIFNSINKINKDRFLISEQVVEILNNTALRLGYEPKFKLTIGKENIVWNEVEINNTLEGKVDGITLFILKEMPTNTIAFKSRTKEIVYFDNMKMAKESCEISLFNDYQNNA